jgi:Mrp family chromosome partitioning ATPase
MKVIVVLSGKGGVGKSTLAVEIATILYLKGHKIGLLDVDLCGPSVPQMLGLKDQQIHMSSQGWVPVYLDHKSKMRFAVMSIGFLLNRSDDPIIWRGPKKSALIKQFLNEVCWGDIDYLIIDTPPGTSDEHLTVLEQLRNGPLHGAVLVTTPQVYPFSFILHSISSFSFFPVCSHF